MKKREILINVIFVIALLFFLIAIFPLLVSASLSNESLAAKNSLIIAEKDILEMVARNIPINRMNETYQEALQLYSAQLALEERGNKANYKLVMEYTSDISSIKKTALESDDELKIFNEHYNLAKNEINLSDMENEYKQIMLSFQEERFEDTLKLIKEGYDRISEIQSSQTAVKAVYSATARTLKNFFFNNWLKILIILAIISFILIIFRSTLNKLMVRLRLNNLIIRKKAINGVIKNIQESYFKKKSISEGEYRTKLKKYGELVRDINRQIMVLNEEIFKEKKKENK